MEHVIAHRRVGTDRSQAVAQRRVIGPLYAAQLWKMYDAALRPLNLSTPCRQSFHRASFFRLMIDPRVLKLVVGGAVPEALAAITRRCDLLPWVSAPYFERREAETGRAFAYVPILVVDPAHREGRVVASLLRDLRSVAAARWGVHDLGFDVCDSNAALPLLMERALGVSARVDAIGAQRYFCASDLEN